MKALPARNVGIRQANEKLLLRLIRDRKRASQSELASITGLQPSTICRIIGSLVERDVIRQEGAFRPDGIRKGRRPVFFALNESAAFSIGIDLASDGAALLLVDLTGGKIGIERLAFRAELPAPRVVALLAAAVARMLKQAGIRRKALLGIGLGAPGLIDIDSGCVVKYARFRDMVGFPLRDRLSASCGVPVHMHNGTSLIALSEYRYGQAASESSRSLAAILIREGVGGAWVNDGRIFTSQGRTAFEAGHLFVSLLDGTEESLEDRVSEPAILRTVRASKHAIRDMNALVRALQAGDPAVIAALEKVAAILAKVSFNIALLLRPQSLLFITRYRPLSTFFAEHVGRSLMAPAGRGLFDVTSVIASEYDPVIACRGAADLVFDEFFS